MGFRRGCLQIKCSMLPFTFSSDAFGDRFALADLPLPRPARGYAVQMLDTDTLLDRSSGNFLPVRASELDGLFPNFDDAYIAASHWVETHCKSPLEHRLAIVPAGYDDVLRRHVLIYGVLCGQP